MMSNMNFTYMNEDSIERLLKCSICLKPFIDPVITRDNDRFCRRCVTEKLQADQSPNLNRQSSFIENLIPIDESILLDMLDNLLVQCSECQQINIRRKQFEKHLITECPKRIALCKASDLKCPWNGSFEDLDNHVKTCTFELLRPILSEALQSRISSNEQQQQEIEQLKKQIEQYENRIEKLQKGFRAFSELTSQQKLRYDNIQKDLQEIRELYNEQNNRLNQIEQTNQNLNNETQIKQLQKQDQYRKNEIIRIRQISEQHQVQIHLLARKKSVIPSGVLPINQRIEELVETFEPNSEIDLDDNKIKDADLELICKKLIINKQCRKLRLERNEISAKGVAILSDTLYGNTSLSELHLSNNRISDMGAHALAQVLSINNWTLEWLELHSNNITDEGIEYLAEMLKTNKTITLLGLSFNRISDRGVRLLASAIGCYNEKLEWLHLASNKLITDACVDDLVEMLKQNQSLQALWINDCSLSIDGADKLRQVTKSNTNFILEV